MSQLRQFFFDPPSPKLAHNLKWKYGFLGALLVLLAVSILMNCTFEPAYPYQNLISLIVPTILVLNHLTTYFYFGPRFTFPFRLFSVIFLIVGCAIVFSHLFGFFGTTWNRTNFNLEVRQSKGAER